MTIRTRNTVAITWLAIITVILLGGRLAHAEDTSANPEAYCWEQQAAFINEGVEMPTSSLETSGQPWEIIWENGSSDTIPGDQITVSFADGVEHITGTTAAMADHLLTLNNHWKAGREPFAVRYEGTIFMIVPYWDNQSQESYCMSLPLTR